MTHSHTMTCLLVLTIDKAKDELVRLETEATVKIPVDSRIVEWLACDSSYGVDEDLYADPGRDGLGQGPGAAGSAGHIRCWGT